LWPRVIARSANHLQGGRGVYFDDPDGHLMEIITHPYGDRPEQS
jgi:catechol 2,3-dioxygenase-like lactoylglutathione lyase family enzyme